MSFGLQWEKTGECRPGHIISLSVDRNLAFCGESHYMSAPQEGMTSSGASTGHRLYMTLYMSKPERLRVYLSKPKGPKIFNRDFKHIFF